MSFSLNDCLTCCSCCSPQGIVPTLIIIYTALGRTTELTGMTTATVTGTTTEPMAEGINPLSSHLQQAHQQRMVEDHHVDLEQCLPNRYANKSSMDLELSSWQATNSISFEVGHQRNVQELSSRHRPEMSSRASSIHAASDCGMGCSHIPTAYTIRDHNLDRVTDARELGMSMSMSASLAHITGPVRALPAPEGHGASADSRGPPQAPTRSCSDGDFGGKYSYPRGSGNIGGASDEPSVGLAAIHQAPSQDRINSDALVVAGSTSLLAEDFRANAMSKAVDQGHFKGILRTGPSVASVRLLPLLPGISPAPIPSSSVVAALYPSSSPA